MLPKNESFQGHNHFFFWVECTHFLCVIYFLFSEKCKFGTVGFQSKRAERNLRTGLLSKK